MIEVKKPILLDEHLADSAMLHPTKGTLKLEMTGVSETTLTLSDKAEGLAMHAWVKMYNQLGFVGIFRRTSQDNTVTVDKTYTLRHGIDILQDSVYAAETEFSGTKAEFITAVLNQQTQLIQGPNDNAPRKPWVLGSCADASTYSKKINYDNLSDLMNGLVDDGGDYYFAYDQTVWPWTVSLVAKPSSVASEFRLNRNIEKCKIKDNDSELCTRLILNVNKMVDDTELAETTGKTVKQNESVIRTYDNAAAQNAGYGVIVKTADIDVTQDTFPNGPFPEADAWAADFLARRAEPFLQVQIDGFILKGITGDDWDESKLATMSRVSLPDYASAISERCVTVYYTDLYKIPNKVTVSLANALPTFTKSMKSTQQSVSKLIGSGRGTARELESFDQHFQITDDAGNVLKQAGMHLDDDGLLVYADDNVNMVGARFNVQADRIGMVVGYNEHGNYIKAGQIVLSINADHGTTALIQADTIDIDGIVTALTSYNVTTETLHTNNTASFDGEVTFNEGADFNSTDVTGIVNLTCDYATCDDVTTDTLTVDEYEATWKDVSIYHITQTSNNQYFAYTSSSSGTSITGAKYGMIVTGATTTKIYYLGRSPS